MRLRRKGEEWTVDGLLQSPDPEIRRMVVDAFNKGMRRANKHGLDETEGVRQLALTLNAAALIRRWQTDSRLRQQADAACHHMQEREAEFRGYYGELFERLVKDKRTSPAASLMPNPPVPLDELERLLRVAHRSLEQAKVERLKLRPQAAAQEVLQKWLELQQREEARKSDRAWLSSFLDSDAARKALAGEITPQQAALLSMEEEWKQYREAEANKLVREGNAAKMAAATADRQLKELQRKMAGETDQQERQKLQKQADQAMEVRLKQEALTIKLDIAKRLRQTDLSTAA